ncbi:MAG: hypothetical protein ACT6T3_22315, partial [Agrobacterium sp.]|uniref:hypothetical protein n=1 Tax=Agrobacterium sp. TaxID=361 RepID=UPI004034A4CD
MRKQHHHHQGRKQQLRKQQQLLGGMLLVGMLLYRLLWLGLGMGLEKEWGQQQVVRGRGHQQALNAAQPSLQPLIQALTPSPCQPLAMSAILALHEHLSLSQGKPTLHPTILVWVSQESNLGRIRHQRVTA